MKTILILILVIVFVSLNVDGKKKDNNELANTKEKNQGKIAGLKESQKKKNGKRKSKTKKKRNGKGNRQLKKKRNNKGKQSRKKGKGARRSQKKGKQTNKVKNKKSNRGKKDKRKKARKGGKKDIKNKSQRKGKNDNKGRRTKKDKKKTNKVEKKRSGNKQKNKRKNGKQRSIKKGKKEKKNKKRNKQSKENKRKNKKSPSKKGKKEMEKNKVKDKRKIKKISRKSKPKLPGMRQTNTSTSTNTTSAGCPDLTCVVNAASAIKIERDQIKNFFKQKSRIEGQMKTMKGKLSKKGNFAMDSARLVSAVGGNLDNATCGTSSESAAKGSRHKRSAELAKSTAETLAACDASIKAACPKPELNSTVANQCDELHRYFQNQSKTCMIKTGDDSCSCFADLVALKSNISECKIKSYANEIKTSLKTCKSAFGVCKKAQDIAVSYVSTCTQSSESILENLKTLGDNEEASNQVLSKINETINDNDSSSNSTRRRRATVSVTVAEFTTRVTFYTSTMSANLYSSSATTLANNVTQTVITGTVSSAEITSLQSSMSSVSTLLVSFSSAKAVLQAQYKTLTGAVATASEIRVGSAVAQGGTNSVIRKMQIITLAKGAVETVKAKVTAVLAATSTNSTTNEMTEKYFKTVVKNYVSLVETDFFSREIRTTSLEISSASVTVSSASVKASLTTQQASLTTLITAMEEKLTILQKQVKTLSGSTASTFQVYSGSLIGTKETVSSQNLEKLMILTKNLAVSAKVVSKMSEAISGTATTGIESSSSDFKTAASAFVSKVKSLSISTKIVKMSVSVTTLKVTLTTDDITSVTTLKTDLETEMVKIEADIKLVKESFKTVTGSEASEVQIITGKSKGTNNDAVSEAVANLKLLAKNEKALTSVKAKLTAAIEGSATTGTETASATFVTTVTSFVTLATEDITDISLATQAASITIAKVTLSSADITTITTQSTLLTAVIAQITAVTELYQSDIKTLISKEASSAQIASGDIDGNIETAKKEILLDLKALTLTSKAVSMVVAKITSASDGQATTGTEITGAAFVTLVTKFSTTTKKDFLAGAITSMALKIELSKVTLASNESTALTEIKTSISDLAAKVTGQLSMVQESFKEFAGMEATEDEIKMAGSSKEKPNKELNTGKAAISAIDTALMNLKQIKSNKESAEKVKTFLTGLTSGTAESSGTDSVGGVELIGRIAKLATTLETSMSSGSIMSLYISIVSVKVTLTTNHKTQIKTLTTHLEKGIEKITEKMESLQFEFYSEVGSVPSDIQIAAGSKAATKESASTAILSDIKFCSTVVSAVTAIITDLDLALAGTASSGALELTGDAYSTAFASYLLIATEDLMSSSLLSMSFSLTNIKVTLTAAQITTLTVSKTEITTIKTRMETLVTNMKAEFKTISGAEATEIQIAAGDSTVTDAGTAASSLMKSLQIITVSKGAIEKVQATLSTASSGSVATGEAVEASVFMESLEMFFSLITEDFETAAITAMSFSITEAKVTLSAAQIATVKEYQTTISTVIIKISTSISFMQTQVKTLTGKEATALQISVGDNSATVASVKTIRMALYTSINKNKVSLETVLTLLKNLKETGISVTEAGSSETTATEMFGLALKFSMMLSGDFDIDLTAIMIQIKTAKISTEFTSLQLESMTVFIQRFELLVIEIKLTLKVLYYQVSIITGDTSPFDPDMGGDDGGETTDDPDGEGTDDPDGKGTDDPDGEGTDDPDGKGTDDPDGDGSKKPDGDGTDDAGTDATEGVTDPMSSPNVLDLIKKLKALTMSKADIKSVTTSITSLLDGTSGTGTANMMTEEEFQTKIDSYVTLTSGDMISMSSTEIREMTLEITSASVTITSQEIKTSLTTSQSTLTSTITEIEEEIKEIQEDVEKMSGSTASTYQVVTGTIDATEESAANGELKKLQQLSKSITVSGKVADKMSESLGETVTDDATEEATEPSNTSTRDNGDEEEVTEFEGSSEEYITAITEFVNIFTIDVSSMQVTKMSLSILSMKVTLTTAQQTEIRTLRTKLQTETQKMEQLVIIVRATFMSVSEVTLTNAQILTGRLDGTEEDAVNEGIQQMQTVIKNRNACKQVESKLTSAIAGSATEGTVTDSQEFVTLVTEFVTLTSMDVLDLTIVTSSTSITIAKVTLSSELIVTITEQKASLTALIAQLSTMKALTGEFVKFFIPNPLSDVEIAAGKMGADINAAKAQLLLELKALTFSSKAITMISAKITSANSGQATTGTEVTGEAFISLVEEFVSKSSQNFLDVSLTSLAMVIELSKVTLTATQVTTLSTLMVEVNALTVRIEAQISMVQVTFVSIVGVEATSEEIAAAGISEAKPSKGLNTGRAEVSFIDSILMDLKLVTSNKMACEEIKTFLDGVIEGTSGGDGAEEIDSATFVKRVTIFVKEMKMSMMSMSISSLKIAIMSVKFELESNLESVVMEMKVSLEKIIEMSIMQINSLQFQFYSETGAIPTEIQITAGSQEATIETASTAILVDLKAASLNLQAITDVVGDLALALAGTASSGSLELTGEKYSETIASFLLIAGSNMLDESLLTMSFSLTSLNIELTSEQITLLTISSTQLSLIITRIEILIVNIQVEFKTLTGAEATAIQIAAGSSVVADASAAASTFMKSLQIITVNKQAIEMVQQTLSSATEGASSDDGEIAIEMEDQTPSGETGGTNSGDGETEISIFMKKLEAFFSLVSRGFTTSAIAAMSFGITSGGVSLSSAQITIIEEYQLTITQILIQISISISFHQDQIVILTGNKATELQISVGDSSATVEMVKEAQIELYGSIDSNIVSITTVWTLVNDITQNGISVTGSGSVEMTASEFYILIVQFFMMVSGDFKADIVEITTQITTAQITSEMSQFEVTSTSDFMIQVESMLLVDMKMTLRLICFQIEVMTGGETPDVCKPSSTSPTMTTMPFLTTRGPQMMTTRGPSSSMGQESSSPERRRIRLNDKLRSALLRSNMKKLD